jgi:endoglucanase
MTELEHLKDLLAELARQPGVSGMEQAVVRLMRDRLRPFADEISVDSFGNVIATRHGDPNGPQLMIAAHSDEVGAVVTAIQSDGFLSIQPMGELSAAILRGVRVRISPGIMGTVSAMPGHLEMDVSEAKASSRLPLCVDAGARSEEEAREWGVREGSYVVFESPLVELNNPRLVMGKAIDNRIGCAVLIAVFEALAGKSLPGTVYGVVNVLEEVGMRGARMTAFRLQPDYAILLDTVPANDTPFSQSLDSVHFRIGEGPVIQLLTGKNELFLGTVAHPRVRDLILETAEEEDINVQLSAAYGLWVTDGASVHVAGDGIPTGFVSIPRRYAHTPNELADLTDALAAKDLLVAIAGRANQRFKPDFLEDES